MSSYFHLLPETSADESRSQNIQRDSYASYIGHPALLSYMAIGMGECREKVRGQMVEVCGFFLSAVQGLS